MKNANKSVYFFISFAVLLAAGQGIVASPASAAEETLGVIIHEIQIEGEHASDEFIELHNTTGKPVDVSGWKLRKRTKSGGESSVKVFDSGSIIPPKGYFLWANSQGVFQSQADQTSSASLTTDNSLGLFTSNDVLVDTVTWGTENTQPFHSSVHYPANPEPGTSLQRSASGTALTAQKHPSPQKSSDSPDSTETEEEETNNESPKNQEGETDPENEEADESEAGQEDNGSETPSPPAHAVRLNEILPNPSDKGEQGEFIELYNESAVDISLARWTVRDNSKTGKYVFPEGTIIPARGYFLLFRSASKLALSNTADSVSLFNAQGAQEDSVSYTKAKEDISYNFFNGAWSWSRFLTPGAANRANTPPTARSTVPEKIYKDTPALFHASGKDPDNDKLKYLWDFGDGHRSRLANPEHTFTKKGRYTVTLTITDGNDETVKTFDIRVKSYSAPKVRITQLAPNPKGKDTEAEWLLIENHSKETVDLLDWKIATGSHKKKLTNHPIQESFILKPGEAKELTRRHAAFSLNNTAMILELRSPDNKAVQTIQYHQPTGFAEDQVLTHVKGSGWQVSTLADPSFQEPSDEENVEAKDLEETPKSSEEVTQILPTLPTELLNLPSGSQSRHPEATPSPAQLLNYNTPAIQPRIPLDTLLATDVPLEPSVAGAISIQEPKAAEQVIRHIHSWLHSLTDTSSVDEKIPE
jgi:PKD repeat protein